MEADKKHIRDVALKISINTLLSGKYVQEKETEPNYLLTSEEKKIYRLNLMANILSKEIVGSITNLLIDDGTGSIILRSFEKNKTTENLNIGDTILILGKVRIYNQEKYISPEIIKKINPLWLKLRALELNKNILTSNKIEINENKTEELSLNNTPENLIQNKKIEKNTIKESKNEQLSKNTIKVIEQTKIIDKETIEENEQKMIPLQKIINLIKDLDQGNGVLIEEIIERSSLENTEKIIEKMLENGDIFQNSPGKVKVL